MKNKKQLFLLMVIFLCQLSIASFLFAYDTQTSRQSLRGLKGIYVEVEKIEPEIEKDGLTKNLIQRDVELELKKAGIKTLTKDVWFTTTGSPYLYVNANILKLRASKEYIYSINIALRQNVYPVREPIEVIGATTWSIGGIVGITYDLNKIRSSIKGQVDTFIKTYLAINS